MATQNITNAYVIRQDPGTGLLEPDDPASAAGGTLVSGNVELQGYVDPNFGNGLSFVNHDGTNDTVDVDTGLCYIVDTSGSTSNDRGSGGNPQVQSTDDNSNPPTYDVELPGNPIYAVVIPSAVTIDCDDSTLNQIWVNITDVTSNNSAEIRSDSGGTSPPGDTFLKLGEANPDNSSADTRANDWPNPTFRGLTTTADLSDDQTNTIFDYTNQRVGTDLATATSVDFEASAGIKDNGSDQLAVEPADIAGSDLSDDGSDNLQFDRATYLVDSPNGHIMNTALDDTESAEISVPVPDTETLTVYRWGGYQISDSTAPVGLQVQLKDDGDTVQASENTVNTENTTGVASHQNGSGSLSVFKLVIDNGTGGAIGDPGVGAFFAYEVA